MAMDKSGAPRSGIARMKFADEIHSGKPAKFGKSKAEAGNDGEEMKGGEDIQDVVAQHGPADHVEIQHDHAAGKHTMTSKHGGHTHKSEHGSAAEAHEAGRQAAGVDSGNEAANDSQDSYGTDAMSQMGL